MKEGLRDVRLLYSRRHNCGEAIDISFHPFDGMVRAGLSLSLSLLSMWQLTLHRLKNR